MKPLDWDEAKNKWLKTERGVSFEDVQSAIEEGKILDDYVHPNKIKYPNQRIMVVEIERYAYYVPYVESQDKRFLKTVIPSRDATKKYLTKGGVKK